MAVPPDRLVPAESRLAQSHPLYDTIIEVHRSAIDAGSSRYPDPATGFWVFTAEYLWNRGTCCDTGCRHCPYVERAARGEERGAE
jgi:hypothetical protein